MATIPFNILSWIPSAGTDNLYSQTLKFIDKAVQYCQ